MRAHPARFRRSGGQSVIEFALVFPVLCALLLAIIEAGAVAWHVLQWQQLAGAMAQAAAVTGDLPDWWADRAAVARCDEAAASLDTGDPVTVVLSCRHSPWAVNGFAPYVTVEAVAVGPAGPSASPSPEVSVGP